MQFDQLSNCDFVAARSLIDLAASRLALGAPAPRAATTLTRPNRSAQRLSSGRHAVPTANTVGPNDVVAEHGVERGDHLTHRDLVRRQMAVIVAGGIPAALAAKSDVKREGGSK